MCCWLSPEEKACGKGTIVTYAVVTPKDYQIESTMKREKHLLEKMYDIPPHHAWRKYAQHAGFVVACHGTDWEEIYDVGFNLGYQDVYVNKLLDKLFETYDFSNENSVIVECWEVGQRVLTPERLYDFCFDTFQQHGLGSTDIWILLPKTERLIKLMHEGRICVLDFKGKKPVYPKRFLVGRSDFLKDMKRFGNWERYEIKINAIEELGAKELNEIKSKLRQIRLEIVDADEVPYPTRAFQFTGEEVRNVKYLFQKHTERIERVDMQKDDEYIAMLKSRLK